MRAYETLILCYTKQSCTRNALIALQDPKSAEKYPLLSAAGWNNLVAHDEDWTSGSSCNRYLHELTLNTGHRRSIALPSHCATVEAQLRTFQDTQIKHELAVTDLVEEASRTRRVSFYALYSVLADIAIKHAERCRRWQRSRKVERREELIVAHEQRKTA